MRQFLTKNLPTLLLVFLAVALAFVFYGLFERMASFQPLPPTITIVRDTQWLASSSTPPPYQPVIVATAPPQAVPEAYKPDTSYPRLLAQYEALVRELWATNVHRDTVPIDTLGYVALTDSVRANRIVHRQPYLSYKVPIITNTVTITEPYRPTRGLYVGGGLSATPSLAFPTPEVGILYRTKTDRIFGVRAAYTSTIGATFGATTYWPLNRR